MSCSIRSSPCPCWLPCRTVMVVHGADWFIPEQAQYYKPFDQRLRADLHAVVLPQGGGGDLGVPAHDGQLQTASSSRRRTRSRRSISVRPSTFVESRIRRCWPRCRQRYELAREIHLHPDQARRRTTARTSATSSTPTGGTTRPIRVRTSWSSEARAATPSGAPTGSPTTAGARTSSFRTGSTNTTFRRSTPWPTPTSTRRTSRRSRFRSRRPWPVERRS